MIQCKESTVRHYSIASPCWNDNFVVSNLLRQYADSLFDDQNIYALALET